MSRELICSWLKIPADPWPPDPLTLLGLPAGERDREIIERRVHERMECVRRYQLAHPEAVTEVMNRLALAFNDLCQKKVEPPPPTVEPPPVLPPTIEPPPLPAPPLLPAPPVPPAADDTPYRTIEPGEPPLPAPLPADPVYETACSPTARRGLATKRAIYHRISTTRQLLRAWTQAGVYLGDLTQPLRGRDDALDLARQLTIIRQQLQSFPALVGQAGQPGYYVIALARQPRIVQTFQALSASEREQLARDWEAGLGMLAAHQLFLRHESAALRRQGWLGRLVRALVALCRDHPGLWLFLLGLLALNIAHPPLRADWPLQILIIVGGLATLLGWRAYRRWSRRQSLRRHRRQGRNQGSGARNQESGVRSQESEVGNHD